MSTSSRLTDFARRLIYYGSTLAPQSYRLATCLTSAAERLLGGSDKGQRPPPGLFPALALDSGVASGAFPFPAQTRNAFSLEPLLSPMSWTWRRTTRWVKRRRMFSLAPSSSRWKYGMPYRGIKHCLECGKPRLPMGICPNCYAKVRQETIRLQSTLGDEFRHRHPSTEIEFVYENEPFGLGSGARRQIRVDGQRPSWFSRAPSASGRKAETKERD